MDRRQFIQKTGLMTLAAVAASCRHEQPPLGECPPAVNGLLVPQSTRANTADTPLKIDLHSHIFNAHDVPMVDYFVRASLHAPPPLDELLKLILKPAEAVIRALAPTAAEEHEQLCSIITSHDVARVGALATTERLLLNEIAADDQDFVEQIRPIANQEPFRSRYRDAEQRELSTLGIESIREISDPIDEDEIGAALRFVPIQPALETPGAGITRIARIWPFLKRIASRRYHNAYRMLDLYGHANGPVDIFVASTVDYDASLKPNVSSTTIADQMRLMELIAILTNGRVLPFVGYDPRRDIVTDGEALQDVKNAIQSHGHLGVKLYPPMGFAAYGNADSMLNCEWPDDENYGQMLDARLAGLYQWAIDNDIPILAHSNTSNGITTDCEKNGGFDDWGAALQAFDGLRACAGHFGGLPDSQVGLTERMQGFIDLMKMPEARQFFADLAFLPDLFATDSSSGEALGKLIEEATPSGRIADHLVYGSDWYMLTQDPSEPTYALDAAEYLRRVGGDSLVTKVMGSNPARFLRLTAGPGAQPARAGVADFLSRSGVTPHWRRKLPQAD